MVIEESKMKKYQKELDNWFKKNKWKYWHPLAQFTRLVEETGELARILNHLHSEKPKRDDEAKQNLEEDHIYLLHTTPGVVSTV